MSMQVVNQERHRQRCQREDVEYQRRHIVELVFEYWPSHMQEVKAKLLVFSFYVNGILIN